ncbi:hypothetical protein R3P38DRAFT_2672534 [Favolaschia claudopus]|uniref:Uncharacterized protein n=1 Tax=Favolaschia claudopus TaxID=2862362 RepID=A0AAV9Z0D9_9AGAR
MGRLTRSGVQWSPFEFDIPAPTAPHTLIDIVETGVSLSPCILNAVLNADIHAAAADARVDSDLIILDNLEDPDGEWEDEDPVLSRAQSPLSRSPSPLTPLSRSPSPSATSLAAECAPPISTPLSASPSSPIPSELPSYRRRQAQGHKARRQKHRATTSEATPFGPLPQKRHSQRYREEHPYKTAFRAVHIRASGSGSWTGPRASSHKKLGIAERIRRVKELLDNGCRLVEWDGRGPKLIVDAEGRIVAILLGRPEGEDWDEVIREMERFLEAVRKRGINRGVLRPKDMRHRRGVFYVLRGGITKGPGQKKPGNLAHSKPRRQLVHNITSNIHISRIAGFQSSGFARYAPKLYEYYFNTLRGLYHRQPELEQLFPNSIFPTASFNLGPDVVTPEHLDMLNLPHGMCAITSGGKFDHKRGGHIFIKQLNALCEFPSGSTILLLSGSCDHGNTPISKGETRYSMTQYAAGALSRWAAYGYQSTKALLAQPGGDALKREADGEPGERAARAMELLSKISELDEDREAVFARLSSNVGNVL